MNGHAAVRLWPDFSANEGYRWYYVDAVVDDLLVVAIFMRAPVFSARELSRQRRGETDPAAAVNAAIYRNGRREGWVFSEFARADVSSDGIAIGASTLSWQGDAAKVHIDGRQSPWPTQMKLDLTLTAMAPAAREVVLAEAGDHRWQALMPRATVALTRGGTTRQGHGYHDTNHGRSALGVDLCRWRWTRVHGPDETDIYYLPEGPGAGVHVRADRISTVTSACEEDSEKKLQATSGWGLPLPGTLHHRGRMLAPGQLIESSPFYARLWQREGGIDALTEIADFGRFRSPLFSWMSYFRSRAEAA